MSRRLLSETARQRELYKYWQPNESIYPSAHYDESFNRDYQPRQSYDSALTAYAQLGALRCNVKRGMISVVDQSYQYILAEGTKTLSLQDGSVVDHDDGLWFGLRTIPRAVGICATALGQFTTAEAHDGSVSDSLFTPLQFIINDLSKDPRFVNQPFVCGAPYLRFYAGVPIRSPAGFIIGIYSIVDDKPRDEFGEADLNILKDLAATVMDHLVLGTVRGRHHRADRMVKGLGLFVEGKATLRDWWLRSGHLAKGPTTKDGSRGEWTLKAQADAEFGPQLEVISNAPIPMPENTMRLPKDTSKEGSAATKKEAPGLFSALVGLLGSDSISPVTQDSQKMKQEVVLESPGRVSSSISQRVYIDSSNLPSQSPTSSDPPGTRDGIVPKDSMAEESSMSQDMGPTFKRASNLIRESIAVEGCLFLDAGHTAYEASRTHNTEKLDSPISSGSSTSASKSINEEETASSIATNGSRPDRNSNNPRFDSSDESICEVLGQSLKFGSHLTDEEAKSQFKFPTTFLHRLFKKYPSGSILNFEIDGTVSSSDEDIDGTLSKDSSSPGISILRNQKTKTSSKELDAKIIMDAFPGIRTLAFFPLWDTRTASWFCGALAWTNDPLRVLDLEDDMAYLAAFGNSIMAEKARLDVSIADRMKGNFISTVSHELRSPLHGILASAELLKDMSMTPAQIDVIGMINICGRTLLDTINHVLDFTELNRVQKPRVPKKGKQGSREVSRNASRVNNRSGKTMTNMDLSLLTEEVVDSTLAGHEFGKSETTAISDSDTPLPSSELGTSSRSKTLSIRTSGSLKFILEIDWRSSWVFAVESGAWRRILMNIFGNALKYTTDGHIYVSLTCTPNISKQDSRPLVILTVSDTGKGISKDFLKHHVFTPFLQEDTLATGTGLGLSIVQKIVHDLDGHIDIKSIVGSGTEVTVQIPFGLPTSNSSPSHPSAENALVENVCQKMKGLKAYIISSTTSFESGTDDAPSLPIADSAGVLQLKRSLSKTLDHWFGVEVLETHSVESADADVYFILKDELSPSTTLGMYSSEKAKSNHLGKGTLIFLSTALGTPGRMVSEMRSSIITLQQPFGPHKLTKAFDAFLKMKEAEKSASTQPPVPSHTLLPIESHQPTETVTICKSPDEALPSSKTRKTNIDLDSITLTLSTTTTLRVKPSPTPSLSQPFSVLLVDDNEINLKLLVMYMRKLNYPYRTAVNGLEALQAFRMDPLPLRFILMDISMPVMDGMTSTREIRRHERELGIPPATILALTGASSANARQEALLSGVDRFLTKPVPLKVVRDIIDGREKSVANGVESHV